MPSSPSTCKGSGKKNGNLNPQLKNSDKSQIFMNDKMMPNHTPENYNIHNKSPKSKESSISKEKSTPKEHRQIETPRNSISLFRKNKLQILEKSNAELEEKNRNYAQLCYQLKKDLDKLKAERHNLALNPTQTYETDEEELAREIGEEVPMIVEPSTSKDSQTLFRNENWTQVHSKKRGRESFGNASDAKKLTTQSSYWLGKEQTTQNRFAGLQDEENTQKADLPEYIPKPPPIFVDKVENINPLCALLKEHVGNNFSLKILRDNQIKIMPKSQESYRKIVKELEVRETEFFTYKPKNERGFKVILRNMHPSVNVDDLKNELHETGHEVVNIWNIKRRGTNQPLSLFEIEIKTSSNNKEIYSINTLLNTRISFEPPRPKKQVPQCSNCQQYGHTKSFCRRLPKCIKCAGNHTSKLCSRQNWSSDVKCALCNGNHPANYKGCSIYKQILKSRYPTRNHVDIHAHENVVPTNTSGSSYADIARNFNTTSQQSAPKLPVDQPPPSPRQFSAQQTVPRENINQPTNSNEMSEVINLLKALTQQMATMTNLLLNLVSKSN